MASTFVLIVRILRKANKVATTRKSLLTRSMCDGCGKHNGHYNIQISEQQFKKLQKEVANATHDDKSFLKKGHKHSKVSSTDDTLVQNCYLCESSALDSLTESSDGSVLTLVLCEKCKKIMFKKYAHFFHTNQPKVHQKKSNCKATVEPMRTDQIPRQPKEAWVESSSFFSWS